MAEHLERLPDELTETSSVIDRRKLVQAVATAFVGTAVPADRILSEVERLVDDGVFVQIGEDAIGQPRYSTPEMIRLEREIVTAATLLAVEPWTEIDRGVLNQVCRRRGLNPEQTSAALAAAAANRIAIVEGAPGSGKTTTLASIVEVYRAAGCRVVGAASAWRVATMLRDDLRIDARATAAWLAAVYKGQPFLDASTVLVVDEAGLLGSREMHSILAEVRRSGAKMVLVGDREQLQPIGAGPALSLVGRAVEAARVTNIVRQHEHWAREAVMHFGRGDAGTALMAFRDHHRLVEVDGQSAAIRAAVDIRDRIAAENPFASTMLIAKSNTEVFALGREVRARADRNGHPAPIELAT